VFGKARNSVKDKQNLFKFFFGKIFSRIVWGKIEKEKLTNFSSKVM